MKSIISLALTVVLLIIHTSFLKSNDPQDLRNFPIVITLQFHALAMPFKNLKSNFKNAGIGIGTEVSYNGYHNWVQEFSVIWYKNRAVGNGILFSTQAAWRPYIPSPVFGELRAGLGYLISFRPSPAFLQKNGEWVSAGKKGKSMLAVLAGTSLGYYRFSEKTYVAPHVAYQVMFLNKYNKDIPIVPETFVQAGAGIYPKL